MTLTHRPTKDWIVVRVTKTPQAMPLVRGIYVPNPAIQPKKYGEVIAVGPGRVYPNTATIAPPVCAVGDIVMLREVAGDAAVVDGEEYLWCQPDEVLALVDALPTTVGADGA